MNKTIRIIITIVTILIAKSALYSQPKELYLPKNSTVSGISFYKYNEGIITTQDTTVYQITINKNNNPQINELILRDLNEDSSCISYHRPFWVNDTTFGFVKTFYNIEQAYGGHNVLLSYDKGNFFRSIYQTSDHFSIQKTIVQNDSVLFLGVTSDIMNSIEVIKCVHNKNNISLQNSFFVGNIYPEFTIIDDDIILISSSTDSIYIYNFKYDSLITVKTNLEINEDYALFYELSTGVKGELIGIRSNGIYRSEDNGINWNMVLHGENFRILRQQGSDKWWAMQFNSNENLLWRSIDNGITWSALFSVDSRFSILEVVYPNWYWIGSRYTKGKILYGQYNKLSVSSLKNNYEKQLLLSQNYPNPFNFATTIQYNIYKPGSVQIDVYNIYGQFIRNLIKREQFGGVHEIKWDGKDQYGYQVTSGIYIFKFSFNNNAVTTSKIILLK